MLCDGKKGMGTMSNKKSEPAAPAQALPEDDVDHNYTGAVYREPAQASGTMSEARLQRLCDQHGLDTWAEGQALAHEICRLRSAPAQPEQQQQIGQPKGWDERDYKLSSKISCLQSYGLLPGKDNRMISSNDVLVLLAEAAEERYAQKRTA